jgi:hypothetical protein
MSSILRTESSRANGAKSRGPVSAIGKAASAANAIHAHGESDAGFTALLAEILDEFQPETPSEIPSMHTALAFTFLCDHTRTLELLNRYEVRYSREYHRTLVYFKAQRGKISKRTEPNIG